MLVQHSQGADLPDVYPEVPWVSMVKDGSLDGWKQMGGLARYDLKKDGTIVGQARQNTPNSFLTTEKYVGDFVLEYEFKVDPRLNSGVQIRSNSIPDYKNGQVHGYQVEIDPDMERARLWTAGIYDEGRRGWLNDLKENDAARAAFKPNVWNHIRVVTEGPRIRTWINGVPAADLVDSMTMSGFIGLQVHGIGKNPEREGAEVAWRKLRIKDLGIREWQPLFNGKDFSGWKTLPGGEWKMEDGVIRGLSPASEKRHGILLSEKTFKDFTVRAKFKVEKGDSGFYWHAQPVASGVSVSGFQVEVDSSFETGGLYETGGRAWVVLPDPAHIEKQAKYRPGEWTDLSMVVQGSNAWVFINGSESARLTNDTKGNDEGHFGLQLHGGMDMDVSFKDLEILESE
ncbi:MAG: hypothetical protein ACI9DF_003897 [Verrucomicrobiales bacterium]|jgi:hypothetical protein